VYIEQIKSPADLKKLSFQEMRQLAGEIREAIIYRVSRNGGHLASNLGVIELTIALHYVFDSPLDKIIWDVGHQCYTHKILTGRHERFHGLRKYRGLGGFPRRDESEHDVFGTGHSSTSISAALGIVEGRDRNKEDFKVIAVIGDGAMTAGLALEGLNNAGDLKKDLIVILNDNEMSISPNVGALSAYLNRILTGERFRKFKKDTRSFLENIPKVGDKAAKLAQKTEEVLKGILLPGQLFEELGFNYVGPIDGHNIELLAATLKRVKNSDSPVLIHVITEKGRGFSHAENNPSIFHGVGPFTIETGVPVHRTLPTYSEIFGDAMIELAGKDDKIIAVSAAMKEGTGLEHFARIYPERFYDVGIAEQHAVTFAAGMATQGLKPVVAVYSTFLQRAYDQIVHDVCLQNLPVVFAVDRGGIVGDDGPTHNGLFDLSYLRHIPNLTVMSPMDSVEFRDMLSLAVSLKGPVAVRYPRGIVETESSRFFHAGANFKSGEAALLRDGKDVALLALGNTVYPSMAAAERLSHENIEAAVINVRFVKPLDRTLIASIASSVPRIITIEENVLQGGLGSAVLEFLNTAGFYSARVRRLGVPDIFVEQGSQAELRKIYGIDEEGIYNAALTLMKECGRKWKTE
jgi:1-deoxy-D-xylulose-5-phosphate synthase